MFGYRLAIVSSNALLRCLLSKLVMMHLGDRGRGKSQCNLVFSFSLLSLPARVGCAYVVSFAVYCVLQEIGDFENWMKTMEFDCKSVVAAIHNIHQE